MQVAAYLASAGFTASHAPNGDTVYTGTAGTSGGAFNRPVRATIRIDATGRAAEAVAHVLS